MNGIKRPTNRNETSISRDMSKVRILVCKNGHFQDQKVVIVPLDLKQILKIGKNKLKMKKATRAFRFPSGEEIFDANTIKQDDIIALSADKDFIGETRKLHQPSFEDYVVVGQINENQFKEEKPIIRVLAKHSWLEDEAVKQLEKCATTLPNIRLAVGMPDLHPGKGFPIGTAFASEGIIYPHLIGSDIGIYIMCYLIYIFRMWHVIISNKIILK